MNRFLLFIVCLALLLGALSSESLGAEYGFGYQTSIGGALATIADEMGYFTAEGLPVKTRVFNDGTLVNEALAANVIQFGVLGDLPTITILASGLPVKAIACVGGGNKRERLMITDPGITDFTQLVGERIGLTRGTSGFNAFQLLCQQYEVSLNDFTIIHIRPSDMPEALASGQVKAVLTWEPTPSLIEAAGIGHELLNMEGSPVIFPMILVARSSVLQSDPEAVLKVLRALRRAQEFMEKYPGQASQIITKTTGLYPELAQRSLSYHFYTVGWSSEVEASLRITGEMMYAEKTLRHLPQWDNAIDASYCAGLD